MPRPSHHKAQRTSARQLRWPRYACMKTSGRANAIGINRCFRESKISRCGFVFSAAALQPRSAAGGTRPGVSQQEGPVAPGVLRPPRTIVGRQKQTATLFGRCLTQTCSNFGELSTFSLLSDSLLLNVDCCLGSSRLVFEILRLLACKI